MKPSLHEVLKLSYADREKQQQGLKNYGYNYDSRFSNDNQQVYFNPKREKLLFSVAGTHNLKDVGTDVYLAAGKLKDTSRYQEADKALKQAKALYNPRKVSVTGHSLGGTISSYIAQPTDKVLTLNKGVTLRQGYRPNEKAYRTSGDLVSVLGVRNKNLTTLSNKNLFKNVLTSHNVDNISGHNIFV